jgi:hypothetical protein
METAFGCNIENMVILYHSIIGESMALNDLKAGGLSKSEIAHRSEVILECREVFNQAATFPGVGIA